MNKEPVQLIVAPSEINHSFFLVGLCTSFLSGQRLQALTGQIASEAADSPVRSTLSLKLHT